MPGYREEDGVSPDSQTKPFVALMLFLDNWRWQDVPIYLRTEKRAARQDSEIAIQFRGGPHQPIPPEATVGWKYDAVSIGYYGAVASRSSHH